MSSLVRAPLTFPRAAPPRCHRGDTPGPRPESLHPVLAPSGRQQVSPVWGHLLILAIALALCACGDEDKLTAFDVTLTTFSDCEQVGQGGANCADEAGLRAVSIEGRWLFDYRGADTFLLVTENGRTLPGVYFANNTEVTATCTGDGGVCHFARVRSSGEDPQSGCARQSQRLADLVVIEGALSGELFEESFTGEECETPQVRQVRIEVSGTVSEETVPAREEYAP